MGRLLAVGLALLAALGGASDRAAAQEPARLALLIGNQFCLPQRGGSTCEWASGGVEL